MHICARHYEVRGPCAKDSDYFPQVASNAEKLAIIFQAIIDLAYENENLDKLSAISLSFPISKIRIIMLFSA